PARRTPPRSPSARPRPWPSLLPQRGRLVHRGPARLLAAHLVLGIVRGGVHRPPGGLRALGDLLLDLPLRLTAVTAPGDLVALLELPAPTAALRHGGLPHRGTDARSCLPH